MDSKLVVEQMSGRWQIKHAGLRPLAASAAALSGRFDSVRYTWIPRERNQRADALANAAMDGKPPPDLDLSAATAATSGSAAPRSWAPRDAGTATRLYCGWPLTMKYQVRPLLPSLRAPPRNVSQSGVVIPISSLGDRQKKGYP